MWLFILSELTLFALLLLLFSGLHRSEPALFAAGQAALHPLAGLLNTLALLSASALVAQGVVANRGGAHRAAARWFQAGLALGLLYLLIKGWEYGQLGAAGYGLHGNRFFTAYFLLTGFHALHVILGILILAYLARRLRANAYPAGEASGLEAGACYWHMVDLLWLLLFPLVYVIH